MSPRLLVPAGLLLAAAGMALMTRIGLHSGYASPVVLPSLLLIGLGLGVVFAPCYSLGTSGVTDEDAGVASATINVCQQIGAPRHTQPSAAEIATDGAPACVELKGAS